MFIEYLGNAKVVLQNLTIGNNQILVHVPLFESVFPGGALTVICAISLKSVHLPRDKMILTGDL